MAALENRVQLQKSHLMCFKAATSTAQKGLDDLSLEAAQTQLERLQSHWTKFDAENEKLLSSKTDIAADHVYFTENIYQEGLKYFQYGENALHARIADINKTRLSSGRDLANMSINQSNSIRGALPVIKVPKFSGNYRDWRHFHDKFKANFGERDDIDAVDKVQLLLNHLEGDAARLVSNVQVNKDSFAFAWDTLVTQYENKRLLISSHLEKLFSLQPLEATSAGGLRNILNTVNEALNAIKAENVDTDNWDPLLVHLIIKNLDEASREAWELSLGTSTDFPTFVKLKDFISGRIRAREVLDANVTPSRRPAAHNSSSKNNNRTTTRSQASGNKKQSPAVVHLAQTASQTKVEPQDATTQASKPRVLKSLSQGLASEGPPVKHTLSFKSNLCSCCGDGHFIVGCPRFQAMSPDDRFLLALNRYLCRNCLGAHKTEQCRSQRRCTYCNASHHSMIHDSKVMLLANNTSAAPDQPSGSSGADNIEQ